MACIVLGIYMIGGILLQKPPLLGFIKNLVPACPIFLWPLIFVVELIGLVTKPFALTVRLFANMTAGHCILLSLAVLAGGAVKALGGVGMVAGGVAAVAATGIYGLEVFVALLQAYIFTYLSAIFIGSYLVPEH
jgi:F-type H+-transporting ATPase subunit a